MRLQTKLVLAAMAVTCAMVVVLSAIFLGELLRQRIAQTTADNEVLAHEVVLMARQALEIGLRENPPKDLSDRAFDAAVVAALRAHDPLADTMNAIIRYSPTVQDVSVTDVHSVTLVGTDPDALEQRAPARTSLAAVRDGSFRYQVREMFGRPHVLDIAAPLDRNGQPFVTVHVGVRSSFLRATYEPWLHEGLWFALAAALVAMLAAALLVSAALQPINRISDQLETLTRSAVPVPEDASFQFLPGRPERDAVVRVGRTIDRLGRKMRSTEAEYTALQTNLNHMLDALRDGVLLFTADGRAAMVSDSVARFLSLDPQRHGDALVGRQIEQVFGGGTALGAAVLQAAANGSPLTDELVVMENGRRIQLSVARVQDASGDGQMGILVTLRDIESAIRLEQEVEVSRRLVAIGRLTAGVGHEVKNPINAMVLHLELLRGKLAKALADAGSLKKLGGVQQHVDILAGEMQRLDRVVQTLTDFTRPLELHLGEHDLLQVVGTVVELMGAELTENRVRVEVCGLGDNGPHRLTIHADADLIRQAILNLLLNAMQAMPNGGLIQVVMWQEAGNAVVEVTDEGEGIAPELLPRIFDLFFTTKETGSGIGLASTYRILQMHGGALEVRSSTSPASASAPRGTTFTVRLPLATQAAAESSRNGRVRMEGEVSL